MTIEIDPLTGSPILSKPSTPSTPVEPPKLDSFQKSNDQVLRDKLSADKIIETIRLPTQLPKPLSHSKYTLVRPTIIRRITDVVKVSGCDSMQQIKLMKSIEDILDSFTL